MNLRLNPICVVNPSQFKYLELIGDYLQSNLSGEKFDPRKYSYSSQNIAKHMAKQFDIKLAISEMGGGYLDLTKESDQEMLKWVLKNYSDSLVFLLQNGKFYNYKKLNKMFSNGEFERITEEGIMGGATEVIFIE